MSFTFISGATGGLGKAFAVQCAMRGENLFLTSTKNDKLKVLAEALSGTYKISVNYKKCNMAESSERDELISYIKSENMLFNKIINTAGLDYEGEFLTLDNAKIRNLIRVNVESVIDITYSIMGLRAPEEKFNIITISSLAGHFAMPFKALYAASKSMLTSFYRALAREVKKDNVSVMLLCPAGIPTNPEWTKSVESQGFISVLSTKNVGIVVFKTLLKADKGTLMYIPGLVNNFAAFIGGLMPSSVMSNIIYKRWVKTRARAEKIAQ